MTSLRATLARNNVDIVNNDNQINDNVIHPTPYLPLPRTTRAARTAAPAATAAS